MCVRSVCSATARRLQGCAALGFARFLEYRHQNAPIKLEHNYCHSELMFFVDFLELPITRAEALCSQKVWVDDKVLSCRSLDHASDSLCSQFTRSEQTNQLFFISTHTHTFIYTRKITRLKICSAKSGTLLCAHLGDSNWRCQVTPIYWVAYTRRFHHRRSSPEHPGILWNAQLGRYTQSQQQRPYGVRPPYVCGQRKCAGERKEMRTGGIHTGQLAQLRKRKRLVCARV